MSPNETFVLETLQRNFGGVVAKGEDPPDAYLHIDEKKIAVEVTRLVEQVKCKKGKQISRLTQDAPAKNLANEIERKMQDCLPKGKYVALVVPTPVNNIRRTRDELVSAISERVENGPIESEIEIEGNRIDIYIYNGVRQSGKRVLGYVSGRYSDANIPQNAKMLLEDRISSKAKKCKRNPEMDEYWLALYNDYWVVDAKSYCLAYERIDVKHEFDKIFVINGYGEVHQICQT